MEDTNNSEELIQAVSTNIEKEELATKAALNDEMDLDQKSSESDCSSESKISQEKKRRQNQRNRENERRRSRDRNRDKYRNYDRYDRHRDRDRDRDRDRYRDKYRDKRSRHDDYESCSDSQCSYDDRRERDRGYYKEKHRRDRERRRYYKREKYSDEERNRHEKEETKHDIPKEDKILSNDKIVKAKGRGLNREHGLRSWDDKYVKPKEQESQEKSFKLNEDWINNELKELEKGIKTRRDSKWSHDKFEKINRKSESEDSDLVRMSPPLNPIT